MIVRIRTFLSALFFLVVSIPGYSQNSWQHLGPTEESVDVLQANGKVFHLTNKGLYSSTNLIDWTRIKTFSGLDLPVCVLALSNGDLFIAAYDGYHRSTDGGATWRNTKVAQFSTRTCVQDRDGYLYSGHNGPILRSSNNGATWQVSDNGTTQDFFDIGTISTSSDGAIYAGNQGISGGMIYKSTDHGNNWALVNTMEQTDVAMVAALSGGKVFASYGNALYKSDQGTNWNQVYQVDDNRRITSLLEVNGVIYGVNKRFGGTSIIINSSDGGNNWGEYLTLPATVGSVSKMMITPTNQFLLLSDSGLFIQGEVNAVRSSNPHPSSLDIHFSANPSDNETFLDAKGEFLTNVEVLDVTGRLVAQNEIHAKSWRLDTQVLPNGVYNVRVQSGAGSSTVKLLVQHSR